MEESPEPSPGPSSGGSKVKKSSTSKEPGDDIYSFQSDDEAAMSIIKGRQGTLNMKRKKRSTVSTKKKIKE